MYAFITLLWSLLVDATFSWARMFLALGISIAVSIALGILAARSSLAERILMPIVDVLQTLPTLAFFPVAVFVIVGLLPGYIGINAAVVLLIIAAMIWNIIFGVYESIKSLPSGYVEMSLVYGMSRLSRIKKIYIPVSMPKVIGQSILSWSIGLFYLVTSEMFSTGNSIYYVKYGIGVELLKLGLSGNLFNYIMGISVLIIFVVGTRFLFFMPLEKIFNIEDKDKKVSRSIFLPKGMNPLYLIKKTGKSKSKGKRKERRRHMVPQHIAQISSKAKYTGRYRRMIPYIKYMVIAALAAVAILVVVSNPVLESYESTTLISLSMSFIRVWAVFALIFVLSIFLGIYIVFKTKRRTTYMTLLQILASIPAPVLLPVIVRYISSYPYHAEMTAFLVFFLSGIWYSVFSIVAVGDTIPKYVSDVVNVFRVKGKQLMRSVYIKALMPGIITGGITAIAAEWNASIVAERFTTTAVGKGVVLTSVKLGIGKLLDVSLANGNMTLMVIALINLTVMIIIINKLLWSKLYNKTTKMYK